MEWAQVLVIILSVVLAIFLLLSIMLVIMLIKITRQIKAITGVAERAVLRFEGIASNAAALFSAKTITKVVSDLINKSKNKS